jgi:hypothetical protein
MKNSALLPASREVREWCSILAQDVKHWPGVKMNHVFGKQAFYHRKVMFAMLPDKRTLKGPASISFIASPKDDDTEDPNWQTFELERYWRPFRGTPGVVMANTSQPRDNLGMRKGLRFSPAGLDRMVRPGTGFLGRKLERHPERCLQAFVLSVSSYPT